MNNRKLLYLVLGTINIVMSLVMCLALFAIAYFSPDGELMGSMMDLFGFFVLFMQLAVGFKIIEETRSNKPGLTWKDGVNTLIVCVMVWLILFSLDVLYTQMVINGDIPISLSKPSDGIPCCIGIWR